MPGFSGPWYWQALHASIIHCGGRCRLCRNERLATADAIIYATAVASGAELLTCDGHFEGLDGVCFVPKRTA